MITDYSATGGTSEFTGMSIAEYTAFRLNAARETDQKPLHLPFTESQSANTISANDRENTGNSTMRDPSTEATPLISNRCKRAQLRDDSSVTATRINTPDHNLSTTTSIPLKAKIALGAIALPVYGAVIKDQLNHPGHCFGLVLIPIGVPLLILSILQASSGVSEENPATTEEAETMPLTNDEANQPLIDLDKLEKGLTPKQRSWSDTNLIGVMARDY
jgi:hypothetical protein